MENKKSIFVKFNIIAIICITIFCVALSQKQLQNDTFYTIKIGQHIVDTKTVDMQEVFSWHKDLKYTYPHWLYDVGIYLIYNTGYSLNGENGGMMAIYISTCIFSTILGILIYITNIKINRNHVISFFLTLIAIYFLRNFLAARAQLVSYIMFVLEVYCIEKFLDTRKIRYGLYLFILTTIIANIHVAVWYMFFIIMLPYFGEYIITLIINKKEELKEKIEKINFIKRENVKWLIIIAIVCMLAGLLTPQNTFEPYTYIIKTIMGNSTEVISEHKPIVLIDHKEIIVFLTVLIAFLIFTKAKITLKDLLMLSGLILMTLVSKRQRSMLILIGIYSVNKILIEYLKGKKSDIDLYLTEILSRGYSILIVFCVVFSTSLLLYGNKNNQDYINKELYPVRATDYIIKNLDINKIKLYNNYNYGSYLMYKNIPQFIDSRCDLYTPEFNNKDIFNDSIDISSLLVDYDEKFREYGITHILIESNSKLRLVLDKDSKYRALYYDDNFCIFER